MLATALPALAALGTGISLLGILLLILIILLIARLL